MGNIMGILKLVPSRENISTTLSVAALVISAMLWFSLSAVEADVTEVKADITEVKADIQALREETKADIQVLRTEVKADIQALREETKADIQALREETKADIRELRTLIIGLYAQKPLTGKQSDKVAY